VNLYFPTTAYDNQNAFSDFRNCFTRVFRRVVQKEREGIQTQQACSRIIQWPEPADGGAQAQHDGREL
jgi:hypothetical protein